MLLGVCFRPALFEKCEITSVMNWRYTNKIELKGMKDGFCFQVIGESCCIILLRLLLAMLGFAAVKYIGLISIFKLHLKTLHLLV